LSGLGHRPVLFYVHLHGEISMRVITIIQSLRNRSLPTIVAILVFSLIGAPTQANPILKPFIIQGGSAGQVAQLVEAYGGSVTANLEVINGVSALLSPTVATRLLKEPAINAISPNSAVRVADKGGIYPIPETEYPQVVGADFTWDQGDYGSGIAVAIIDTGLAQHAGIFKNLEGKPKNRITAWVDFVEGRPTPHDPNGHGTHIAGIIANTQMNSKGEWNGIAPGVQLVGVRVLDEQGYGTYAGVIEGIEWVITHKDELNIRVMNLSLISQVRSPYWADPLNQAVMQAWAQGITVVVAAGNTGPSPMSIGVPGNNPYVITVGAFTDNFTPESWNDDYITPFSSAGPTLDGFVKPDLVAPGAHMVSTMLPSSELSQNHEANRLTSHYFSMAGTSQAAAVASGAAALALSHDSGLSPDEVKFRLMFTAFPWIDPESTDALYSVWQQGAGRINIPDAVYSDIHQSANRGLDIVADLAGSTHYEGFSYYDEASGEFRLKGEYGNWAGGYGNWAGGYGNWAGGYGNWAGGYGNWAGGYGNWAGGYGNWAGGYGNWAGGYGNWAGGYGNWAGGYGNWAGGYGNWAGGYGNWAGGYGNWAGGYGNWAGSYGEAAFAEAFANWSENTDDWTDHQISGGTWVNFDR
jgi:serine protease AprX